PPPFPGRAITRSAPSTAPAQPPSPAPPSPPRTSSRPAISLPPQFPHPKSASPGRTIPTTKLASTSSAPPTTSLSPPSPALARTGQRQSHQLHRFESQQRRDLFLQGAGHQFDRQLVLFQHRQRHARRKHHRRSGRPLQPLSGREIFLANRAQLAGQFQQRE